jgi:HD-GYP domain-containing protein (c-di-GMP phosphodiesterase class II)
MARPYHHKDILDRLSSNLSLNEKLAFIHGALHDAGKIGIPDEVLLKWH